MWLACRLLPRTQASCPLQPFPTVWPSVISKANLGAPFVKQGCGGPACSNSAVCLASSFSSSDVGRFAVVPPVWRPTWQGPSSSFSVFVARHMVLDNVDACPGSAWGQSTRCRYTTGVRVSIQSAEEQLGEFFLPMDTYDKFVAVFVRMKGQSWATIRVSEAAIRAWHVACGEASIFDAAWSSQAALFWRGLKKFALHTSSAKVPIGFESLFAVGAAQHAPPPGAGLCRQKTHI